MIYNQHCKICCNNDSKDRLVLLQEGAAIRPVVTFSPDYKKIFTSEQITMTCDVGSTIGEGMDYIWYKDSKQVYNGKSYTIQKAKTSHSGSYQCQTRPGEISDPARLDVSHGWLILQTPLYVYEGDDLYIRCHHYPGYEGGWTHFSKDKRVITDWSDNAIYYIGNVNKTTSGTYGCKKTVSGSQYEDTVSLAVQELFKTPEIRMTPQSVIEGDPVTLTCDTSLPLQRRTTQLQFAFYREGLSIGGFSSSNNFGTQSVQPKHSGRYFCEITTSNSRVRKTSYELNIQVKDLFTTPTLKVTPYPVLKEDNLTLNCETSLHPSKQNTQLRIAFYREGGIVQGFGVSDTYEVYNVQLEDSGKYSCDVETTDGRVRKRSAETIIQIEDLFSSPNITMTNNLMFEGDPMTLTCDTTLSPHIKSTELQFVFYKDEKEIQGFNSSNTYEVQSAQLEDSGNYTCQVKTSNRHTMKISGGHNIWVQELFSSPILNVSPELVNEGNNMTLTCITNLTKHRRDTELQYVFYRDREIVQKFSSDNKYEVRFIQDEHSGNYSCEIQTPNSKIKKRSQNLHVQVADNEYPTEPEVSYSVLGMTSRPQSRLPKDSEPDVVYAVVNSKAKSQGETSQETSDTSNSIYQNINPHR
ncbi:Fc receptor-like protein 5 [Leptodactylus fuscus]|uniref:Fc receptor-like protein 5 n=1 Tax=Leptodactylus fuscus TaxID=238119 RepID=UPI003F4EF28A